MYGRRISSGNIDISEKYPCINMILAVFETPTEEVNETDKAMLDPAINFHRR